MKRLLMTGALLFGAVLSGKAAMAKKIDREALAKKIKALDGLGAEERSALLGLLSEQKKYGLVWEEKPEDVEEAMREKLPVLAEVKERAIVRGGDFDEEAQRRREVESGGSRLSRPNSADATSASLPCTSADAPNHILIEGDNLHALTCLTYTHSNKIDVIYIDPPYNTGNKDFVYNDRFVDKEDAFRHSKWLSFMAKRLRIAKGLLSDKGVIFISIDDNEQAQLKLLCDEIFGEENFIGAITWESTTQPTNAGTAIFQLQKKVEFILCYAKCNGSRNQFKLREIHSENNYPHVGKFGKCRFEVIEKSDVGRFKRDTMKFTILGQYPRAGKRWQIGEETARELERQGKVELVNGIVKRAVYPEDENNISYIPFWSHFDTTIGTALKAKKALGEILGQPTDFDTVKPVDLITELVNHVHPSDTILDFFAGSGTTLHAVMKLNAEVGTTEVDAAHRVKYARTAAEIDREYTRWCTETLGQDFDKGAVVPKLKGDILQMMEDVFGKDENEGEKIVLAKGNREIFRKVVRKALDRYLDAIKTRRRAARERMFTSYEWEVPLEREYDAETNERAQAIIHAMEPFVRAKGASNPEKGFEAYLEENREHLSWWYKNGDSGREHFAVPYRDGAGEKALFYVDFVVRAKTGAVYLFDTKTRGSDPDAPAKHNALIDFMAAESAKRGCAMKCGILIHDAGLWRYSPMKIENTIDLAGWDAFIPAQTT